MQRGPLYGMTPTVIVWTPLPAADRKAVLVAVVAAQPQRRQAISTLADDRRKDSATH